MVNGTWSSTGEERLLLTYSLLALIGSTLNVLLLTSLALLHSDPASSFRAPAGGPATTSCKGNGLLVASQCLVHLVVTCLDLPFCAVCILAGLPFDCVGSEAGGWPLGEWRDRAGLAVAMTSALLFLALSVEHLGRSDARRDDALSLGGAAVMAIASWGYGIFLPLWFFKPIVSSSTTSTGIPSHSRPGLTPSSSSSEWCLSSPPLLVPLSVSVPCALALVAFALAAWRSSRGQSHQKRERKLLRSDAAAFATFLCFWAPFVVASALEVQDQLSQLLEVGRGFAVACPLVYGAWHDDLRSFYGRLARYCCCKANAGLLPDPDSAGRPIRTRLDMRGADSVGGGSCSGMDRRPRTALLLPVSTRGSGSRGGGRADHYL